MTEEQIASVTSYQHEMRLKAERRALPEGDDEDPASWPYSDSPVCEDPMSPPPGGYSGDDLSINDFRIKPREIKCGRCHYVHRDDQACEEVW